MKESCGSCKFWFKSEKFVCPSNKEPLGDCRRNSPGHFYQSDPDTGKIVMYREKTYPMTAGSHWCGQYHWRSNGDPYKAEMLGEGLRLYSNFSCGLGDWSWNMSEENLADGKATHKGILVRIEEI